VWRRVAQKKDIAFEVPTPQEASALHVYGLGFATFLVFGGILAWAAFALFAARLAPVLMARSD
jgi:hypothetical protein